MREKSSRYGTKSGSSSYWQSSNGDSIVESTWNEGQRRSGPSAVLTSASHRSVSGARINAKNDEELGPQGMRYVGDGKDSRKDEIELANAITPTKIPPTSPYQPLTPFSTQKQVRIASQDFGPSHLIRKSSMKYRSDDEISLVDQHAPHDAMMAHEHSGRSDESLATGPAPIQLDATRPSLKTSKIPAPLFAGAQVNARQDLSKEKPKSTRFHAV